MKQSQEKEQKQTEAEKKKGKKKRWCRRRAEGCKTTGDEFYRGKKRKRMGIKIEIQIAVERGIKAEMSG